MSERISCKGQAADALLTAARTAKRSQSYGIIKGAVAAIKCRFKRIFGEKIFRAFGEKDEL